MNNRRIVELLNCFEPHKAELRREDKLIMLKASHCHAL